MSWATRVTNRATYISELRNLLARLPETERSDILRDQEEFFREAILSGRTEADVIGSLGDPKQLAKTLIAESAVAASENAFRRRGVTQGSVAAGADESAAPSATAGSAASFGTQVNATLRAFVAIITLAPFNLIFVLGPFLGLMACLFAAWAVGGVMLLCGLLAIFFVTSEMTGVGASIWAHASSVFFGLGVTCFSVAFLAMMTLATSKIAQLTVRYLRWNLDLISQRKA
ncbi:hypothetical protein BH10BDE1_BH10BDE1_02800 [soil metagenome]